MRNKFTDLQTTINGLPSAQFTLEGYHTPYRLDINNMSSGILVYVKSSVPSRFLCYEELHISKQAILLRLI